MFKYLLTAALVAAPACHAQDNQGFFARIKNWWNQQCGYRTIEKQQAYNFEYPIEWTLDEVIGLEHIKARFEAALAYAEDPVKYASIAGHLSTHFVFYGEPRTSKSFFASALAGEMKKRNPHMHILRIPENMLNTSDMQFTIDLIREYAPCIVIIDEIDVIDGCHKFWIPYYLKVGREFANMSFYDRLIHQLQGKSSGITPEEADTFYKKLKEKTYNNLKFLQYKAFSPSPDKPIFMIFSSHNVEPCDLVAFPELAGSTQCIEFTLPSTAERAEIIHKRLERVGYKSDNFDIPSLTEKTDGSSFEDIKFCINTAILNAGIEQELLTTAHIIDAIDSIKIENNKILEAQ